MARMAVNVVIDKRKALDGDSRSWSVASILIHVICVLALILSSVYAEHRKQQEPKVYRVSIATLSSAENANMGRSRNRPRTVEQAPVRETPSPAAQKPKPVVQKPKPQSSKPASTKPNAAVGIDTSKQTQTKPKETTPEPAAAPSAGTSANGRQTDTPRVGFGNQGSVFNLDQANFEYSYYLGLVQGKIGSNWVRNYIGHGKVKVYFRIARSGKVVSAIIEQSSGDIGLDRMALRAVTASDPLPPLPEGYVGDVLGIHIWFNYEE